MLNAIEKLREILRKNNHLTVKSKYSLDTIFTPSTYAYENYAKRESLESRFTKALKMPGMQIVIYGHSGGGKSTLVNRTLKKNNLAAITTQCDSGTTLDQLILNAFDKLDVYYTDTRSRKMKAKISSKLKASYLAISAQLQASIEIEEVDKQRRILPPQLNSQRLLDFIGEAKCLWVIEDFHKVRDIDKQRLSQVMKQFVDGANEYKQTKIIAIGACDTAREVVEYDKEMSNRITEINVPLLSVDEMTNLLTNGAVMLNIKFSQGLVDGIIKHVNKLGSIAHHLAYNICVKNDILQTSEEAIVFEYEHLSDSMKLYVSEKEDSFKRLLDEATKQKKGKYKNVELILKAMVQLDDEQTHNEILTKIKSDTSAYPPSNLSHYLKMLVGPELDEIIRINNSSGRYSFSDPFFKAYLSMHYGIQLHNEIIKEINQ